mmetsp:Transcript_4209/g.13082  ORF Transcript_4209/g.13082 Transcript_4209/m.13082 type:complete len:371 (-) Transcript_4209:890-2002(-)
MTREPMTRDDCRALDEYLRRYGLFSEERPRVTEAYDLLKHSAGDSSSHLRREATTLLHSLFGFDRYDDPQQQQQTISLGGDSALAPSRQPPRGPTLAENWGDDEDNWSSNDYDAATLATAAAEHALGDDSDDDEGALRLDAAFPALVEDTTVPPPPETNNNGVSFAAVAAAPPVVRVVDEQPPPRHTERRRRRDVKMPQDLWVPVRDASVFAIRDPLERYYRVVSKQYRAEVIDLHFQSSRTVGHVLDAVLEPTVNAHGHAWVVTGTGHHAPTDSHQKRNGVLFACVRDYLEDQGYDFALAKDARGYAGAFLVYGLLPESAVRPPPPDVAQPAWSVLSSRRSAPVVVAPPAAFVMDGGAPSWSPTSAVLS